VKTSVCLHNYLKSTDAIDYQEPRYVSKNYADYENEIGDKETGGRITIITTIFLLWIRLKTLLDLTTVYVKN
jgi:hypothetical protein